MSKKKLLYELLTDIQEIYPELSKLLLDDMDDPSYIIFCTDENIEGMLESTGIEDSPEEGFGFEDYYEDDDDDDDSGTFH